MSGPLARPPDHDLLPALDGRPGPARHLSSEAARALVDAAIERAQASPDEALAPPPRSRGRRSQKLALAAAVLIGVSVGGAALALVSRALDRGARPSPPRPVERVVEPPPAPVDEPAPPPVVPEPRQRVRATPRKAPRAVGAAPSRREASLAVVPDDLPAEDLLALASERRKAHAWREADELYRSVVARFAATDAAVVAQIASAALHLQHLGDARGALAAYRHALAARPTGTLGEEARYGIAEAQRALGDVDAESRALVEFLDHHPRSALAPAARRRLGELAR